MSRDPLGACSLRAGQKGGAVQEQRANLRSFLCEFFEIFFKSYSGNQVEGRALRSQSRQDLVLSLLGRGDRAGARPAVTPTVACAERRRHLMTQLSDRRVWVRATETEWQDCGRLPPQAGSRNVVQQDLPDVSMKTRNSEFCVNLLFLGN